MKNKGDECVKGFVRFRKVKPCKGFKDAEHKASARLSKIYAGRLQEDGSYAAVIRFRLIIWLIPLILILALLISLAIKSSNAGAKERETETQAEYHRVLPVPDVTVPEPADGENRYEGLYIDIPGYCDCAVDGSNRGIMTYNPENNMCVMKYEFFTEGTMIAQTDIMAAGMAEYVDIYDAIQEGKNTVTVQTKSFSEDRRTEFSSVTQTIEIVKK